MGSDWAVIPLGFLVVVLLVGAGLFVAFQLQPDTPGGGVSDVESVPVGPEKPTPLNSSTVADYATTYEERLFYNDLVASHDHRLSGDERVTTACTPLEVANESDAFRVQLACRGGVADSSRLSESETFTYASTYRITENTTRQTELRGYPFGTDRGFNDERRSASRHRDVSTGTVEET
ncbi:hypothetical protein A6E15_02635 [Natrinema saccharevitans]|uniref:Uncharacterized protein n=1 Tax=Natrinema saccharevitans TaxID=301967 RepID=A0A1S8ASX2_9EURY|nr:hypothetical protein [Natrinema saccharevitans]OLZ39943.1 hypothetical protein A6E15_02635 [Natrinema saccharevitans]